MMKTFSRYRMKLRDEGLGTLLRRRWRSMKQNWQMDNYLVGRLVEVFGNEVTIDGLRFSVDNPNIQTREKSTMYYGIYEMAEQDFVRKLISPDLAVVEMGACIGVVSCVTNRKLKDPQKHVVVEANTEMISTLQRNRERNGCRFKIVNAAVAYGTSEVEFFIGDCFLCSSVGQETRRKVKVPAVTLGRILDESAFEAISLIVDIEGAELALVENEGELIRRHVKTFLLETHPRTLGQEGMDRLFGGIGRLGFQQVAQSRDTILFENIGLKI